MSIEVYKGSTPGPTACIWTPGGKAIIVRNDEVQKPKPRIGTIPYMTDLLRQPHIPITLSPLPRRLISYCCTCQKTVYGADFEDCKRFEHELRYMLVPDLRQEKQ